MDNNFKEKYEEQTNHINILYDRLAADESWESDPEQRLKLAEYLRFCIERFAQ